MPYRMKKTRNWKPKKSRGVFMKGVPRKAQAVSKSDYAKAANVIQKLARKSKSGATRFIQRAFRGYKGRVKAHYAIPHAKYWK